MKLREILSEGLIKLSSKLIDKLVKTFVIKYLAWVQDKIESELEGKDYSEAKKVLNKYSQKYQVSIEDEDIEAIGKSRTIKTKYEIELEELPYYEKLIKLYPDFKNMHNPILTLVMDFASDTGSSNGKYNPNTQTIFMYLKALGLLSNDNLETVMIKHLPNAVGVLEHELTHAIQFIVLSKFHDSQIGDEDSVKFDAATKDKYFNSQIEFDPFIKTMVAKFKAADLAMKKISPDYDRKISLEYFTGAHEKLSDKELQKVSFMKPNEFFISIKKHDKEKWKKAVKLFYQEVTK